MRATEQMDVHTAVWPTPGGVGHVLRGIGCPLPRSAPTAERPTSVANALTDTCGSGGLTDTLTTDDLIDQRTISPAHTTTATVTHDLLSDQFTTDSTHSGG